MRHDRVSQGKRVGYEVVVGDLKKRVYSRRFVFLACGPSADFAEGWEYGGVRFDEKTISTAGGPVGEFIVAGINLITDFFGAENQAASIVRNEPTPERRTEIEAVMEILGLNEDVGIQ